MRIFKSNEVEKYAKSLLEAGYRIFYPENAEYRTGFHFVKNDRIGSCDYNARRGWCFYRDHKPSASRGSATQFVPPHTLFTQPTADIAAQCLSLKREDVKHYRNWGEYADSTTIKYKELNII